MTTVLLAVTGKGLSAAMCLAEKAGSIVWCDGRALSEEQFAARPPGSLTRLDHALATEEKLADALVTIDEHHPSCVIFVERSYRET